MALLGTKQASVLSLSFLETSSVEGTKARVGPEHRASVVWGIAPLRCDFYATQLSHLKCSTQVLKVDSHVMQPTSQSILEKFIAQERPRSNKQSLSTLSQKLATTHLPLCIWGPSSITEVDPLKGPFLSGSFKERPVSRIHLQYEGEYLPLYCQVSPHSDKPFPSRLPTCLPALPCNWDCPPPLV